MPASRAATAPANCLEGIRIGGLTGLGAGFATTIVFPRVAALCFADFDTAFDFTLLKDFILCFSDLVETLRFAFLELLFLTDLDFFGIAEWAPYNVYPHAKSSWLLV